jgi:hypothetical protein
MLPALIGAGASIIGGLMANAGQKKEMAQQKEFAQQGVRWRVEDARASGIHPAVALGANLPSYTPVGLGSGLAEGFSAAGQDISRAITQTQTVPEKALLSLNIERAGLENELLKSQIARLNATPPFPMVDGGYNIPGQPASGVATIPTPFGLPGLEVANPKLAQTAQDHFGEPLEWVYGIGNYLDSLIRSMGNDVARKTGMYPEITPSGPIKIVVRGGNNN